jgi:hypothetical protein
MLHKTEHHKSREKRGLLPFFVQGNDHDMVWFHNASCVCSINGKYLYVLLKPVHIHGNLQDTKEVRLP